MTLNTRLAMLVLLPVALGSLAVLVARVEIVETGRLGSEVASAAYISGEESRIRAAVHVMAGVLQARLAGVGDVPERERIIREMVDPIRFDQEASSYLFVYEGTRCVATPSRPERWNQDFSGEVDTNGFHFIEGLATAAARGGGVVSYVFPKPPSKAPTPKISYVELIPGTSYYVGAGVYVDDVAIERSRLAARLEAEARRATWMLVALVVGVTGLILVPIALWLARSIKRPLRDVGVVLDEVAHGDFRRRIAVASRDEIGRLGEGLNAALDAMSLALRNVNVVASEVASAGHELTDAADQISDGAQKQAASLEQTVASLEEIGATVKQSADSADQAARFAGVASRTAEHGGKVVTAAVSAMGELTQSSKRIADIITTIDEIAFQTNLLALNAAVEAARAGEQGRGFAVVAAEVRTLAQRSSGAAKEIRDLIADALTKGGSGTSHVNASGAALDEIMASVQRMSGVVSEIASASREQSTAVTQVNVAMSSMDHVTQSNAAQTEELSSTAHALMDKAQLLQSLVAAFMLDEHPATATLGRRPARRPDLPNRQAVRGWEGRSLP